MPINVLYIDHSGSFGGAERSLFEMICAFPKGEVNAYFVAAKGSTVTYADKLGIPVVSSMGISQLDISNYSYYRGARWLILLRELLFLVPTYLAIKKASTRWSHIDIIHINDVTNTPSLVICRKLFPGRPIIMHVRCVVNSGSKSKLSRVILMKLKQYGISLVAIDETVLRSLPVMLHAKIIHNSFSVSSRISFIEESKNETIKSGFTVGYVGTFLKAKGIFELIEAARICKENAIQVKFSLLGYKPEKLGIIKRMAKLFGLTQESNTEIMALIERYQLLDMFNIENFSTNISAFYKNIDVLCFPSHFNAVGRPVYEAAFYSVPSIVAIKDPLPDTIIDGETGICIEEKNPFALAKAITDLYNNPKKLKYLGKQAHELAIKNFSSTVNAGKMLTYYNSLLFQNG